MFYILDIRRKTKDERFQFLNNVDRFYFLFKIRKFLYLLHPKIFRTKIYFIVLKKNHINKENLANHGSDDFD